MDKNVALPTCEIGIDICTDITIDCYEGACDIRMAEGDLAVADSVHVLLVFLLLAIHPRWSHSLKDDFEFSN